MNSTNDVQCTHLKFLISVPDCMVYFNSITIIPVVMKMKLIVIDAIEANAEKEKTCYCDLNNFLFNISVIHKMYTQRRQSKQMIQFDDEYRIKFIMLILSII